MYAAYAHPTPLDAPILCQIRTEVSTGSRLVGTILTRLNFSLEDVRMLLCNLANRARGDVTASCKIEVRGTPVNATREEFERTMSHPLHPFDLGSAFSFVKRGGCIPIRRQHEKKILLVDVFPRLPRAWGMSVAAGWTMEPPPPLVKVMMRPGEHIPCRDALAILFVAQGEPGSLITEQVVLERLVMQQDLYGHSYQLKALTTLLNQWNGNVKDCFGRTVLHECVYQGAEEAVVYLLSLPFIRINEQDTQGKTPLHIAVRGGNEFILSRLLESGADVLVADNSGDTALHVSLRLGYDRVVELLTEQLRVKGIEVSRLNLCRNNMGLSPIDIFQQYSPTFLQLCEEGNMVAIKSLYGHYLFPQESINDCDQLLYQSALHVAAASGHVDVLRFLLDAMKLGLLRQERMLNARLQTPLHVAAERGHLSAVKFLHENFPSFLSAQDATGATPLVAALRRRKCHTTVVDYLISSSLRGAVAPNVCDSSGMGALHLLCELGMTRAANSLIVNHGADVGLSQSNDKGPSRYLTKTHTVSRLSQRSKRALGRQAMEKQLGITPLLCSIRGGHTRVGTIEMLLSHGAGTREDEIIELLFYLITNAHYELADYIAGSGMTSLMRQNELLCRFCHLKHSIGIRWCIERACCSLNLPDGGYPLMVSAALGDIEAVNFFLTHGADPNVITGESTPLLVAIKGGHDTVVERLVRAGAWLTSSNSSLSALRAASERGAEFVVRALLGLHVLPPVEVALTLVHVMESVRARSCVAREQVCVHLASSLDLTANGIIHPIELLHLAASRLFFAVVKVLIDKLLALPTPTLREIVDSAPPPAKRSYVLIEPTMVPMQVSSRRLLMPNGRRGLYTPPKSFKRLLVQRYREGVLFHRLRLRDVFSYCAEANHEELLECLLFDVGLKPWPGPDYRGWNAADYAAAKQRCGSLRMFLVFGLVPLRRHVVRCGTPMGALCRAIASVDTGVTEANLLSSVLCNLASMQEAALVRQILLDTCRYYKVSDLSGAGVWLDALILCCVRIRCLSLLSLLTGEFYVTLTRRLSVSAQSLLLAVMRRDVGMVSYFIHHGAPADQVDNIPTVDDCCLRRLGLGKRKVSPLWLAARLGDIAVMEILLSTGSLLPERCTDTTEFCCDALKALVDGATHGLLESQDNLLARGVKLLARAGHVYTLSSVIRDAARKGLVRTVVSLVECYGLRTVTQDMASDRICVLHYLVSKKELSGFLKSLLLHLLSSAKSDEVEAGCDFLTLIRTKIFKVNPVDYALRMGCEEGALLLLGLGLCGSGEKNGGCYPKTSRIIRLCISRRKAQWEEYTVLHAAVELQYDEIARRILEVGVPLQFFERQSVEAQRVHNMPSLAALMVFYLNGYCRRLLLSLGVPTPMRVSPCDVLFLVFGHSSCDEEYREIVRHSASCRDLEGVVELLHGCLPMEFVRYLLSRHEHSFFFDGRSFAIIELTPMGCAVAAGNLPWVQLLAYSSVSTVKCDSVIAKRHQKLAVMRSSVKNLPVGRNWALQTADKERSDRGENAYLMFFTDKRYLVSPLLLCMAIIVESALSGDVERLSQQSQIMRFFLSYNRCLEWKEMNLLAIVLARLLLWDLLEAVVVSARKLIGVPEEGHLFSTITEADIPPIFKRVVGSTRHVMHWVACCAPREVFMLVVKHSQRIDIEGSYDIRGRTSLFYAIQHPCRFALDILISLRVSTDRECCITTGRTLFMLACQRGRLPLVVALLKKAEINNRDRGGNTALLLAASYGQLKVVEHLLASGADPSIRNIRGMTAVMAAAFFGHDHIAVPLAKHFSKTDDFFSSKTTLLHCAAVGGCWRVAEIVVESVEKIDILAKDDNGLTAVYLAYAFGRARVLRILLSAALRKGIEPSPSLLIERQIFACSSALPRYGWLGGVLEVGEALLKESCRRVSSCFAVRPGEITYGSSTSFRGIRTPLLLWCVCNNNVVGIRVLGDMNIADDCAALHEAAKRGYLDVVKLLLKLKMSNADSLDKRGRLPFEVAATYHQTACASVLLVHSKLDVTRLTVPSTGSGQNSFHIASAGAAETLVVLVEVLQQKGGTNWPSVASQLYDALDAPDSSGMTVFESALAMGNPAGVLRVAQVLYRLAMASGQKPNLTVSNSIILKLFGMSPAVRVLLYDVFNVPEVAMGAGFDQKFPERLTFADVRIIGTNILMADAFCAPEISGIFTLDHEIKVASSLLNEIPFKIRYKPLTLETTSSSQKVQLLRWMTSSLILSNYENWSGDTPIDTVELEFVLHHSEEFAEFSDGQLRHSVYLDARQLLAPNLYFKLQFARKKDVARLRNEAEELCQVLTQKLRRLPHPVLTKGQVTIDWGGSHSEMGPEVITRLVHVGLERVDGFLDGDLKNCLNGVCIDDIVSVTTALDRDIISLNICFCYTHEALQKRPHHNHFDLGSGFVVFFNDDTVQDVDYVLHSVLYRQILADVNCVGVSFVRDAFVANVQRCLGRNMMSSEATSFKLEVEDSSLDRLPLHLLENMMTDATEALASLTAESTLDRQTFHSSRIVGNSLRRNFRSVNVLFSPKRRPLVELSKGNLMLCLNPQLSPTRCEIFDRLRSGTLADEILRLRGELFRVIAVVGQHIQMCFPSVTFALDTVSLFEGKDDECVLSALSILCHNSGALVFRPFIDGVSIGRDTQLKDVVRHRVRELTLVCVTSGNATCVLYDSGNFVYYCPLYSVERGVHTTSSWHLLSAKQIASLLVMQLTAVDPTVLGLIDTTKAYACWSQAHGHCTRLVDAGSSRGFVSVVKRNILNLRLPCGVDDFHLTFVGKWRSVKVCEATGRVYFTAPTRSGYYYQHIFMDGQPLSNSPLCIRVRPLTACLSRTKILSTFNTVVVGRPFHVELLLRDKYGNRIETPQRVDVDHNTTTGVARIVSWKRIRVDVVKVEVVVNEVCEKCKVCIRLHTAEDGDFGLFFVVESVDYQTYHQLRLLRGGHTLDLKRDHSAATVRASDRVNYFFRKAVRNAERLRLARDVKLIGDPFNRVFPPHMQKKKRGIVRVVSTVTEEQRKRNTERERKKKRIE